MRYSQPQGLATVDSKILTPELLFLGASGAVNLGTGAKGFTGSPSSYSVTRSGKAAYFSGSSPGRLLSNVASPNGANRDLTYLVAFTPDAAPSGATYSSPVFSSRTHISWDHINSGYQGVVSVYDSSGGAWPAIPLLSTTAKKSTVVCVTITYPYIHVFQDGSYCGSVASYSLVSDGDLWDIGERGNGSGYYWTGSVELAAIEKRSINLDLAKSLSANPWQLFKDNKKPIFIGLGATGGAATAAPAGVSATGSVGTPTISAGAVVTPSGVSATWSVGASAATAGATRSPTGLIATGSIGAVAATAGATVSPSGVSASWSVGSPVAVAGGSAIALPSGVYAISAVGTPAIAAGATVSPNGVQAIGYLGQPVAAVDGAAIALPAGVQASGFVGTPVATGSCIAYPLGLAGYWSVGNPIATDGSITPFAPSIYTAISPAINYTATARQ